MAHETVVLLGSLPVEHLMLDCLVSQFGFSFKEVDTLENLSKLKVRDDVLAVVFRPSSLGLSWDEALKAVLSAFPRAFPIICHGFADHLDWPEAADAGAFHSLPVPFSVAELRQSMGFVWSAQDKPRYSRSRSGTRGNKGAMAAGVPA